MKYFAVYLLVTLMLACGAEDTESKQQPVVLEEVTEEETTGSYYAATEADLPKCTAKKKGLLVYLASHEVFQACDGNGTYKSVSIKGKDGANGKDGAPAEALAQNEWIDNITGKKWLMGGYIQNQPAATAACGGNYVSAPIDDLKAACHHGLFKAYEGKLGSLPSNNAWSAKVGSYVVAGTCTDTLNSNTTIPGVVICVKK